MTIWGISCSIRQKALSQWLRYWHKEQRGSIIMGLIVLVVMSQWWWGYMVSSCQIHRGITINNCSSRNNTISNRTMTTITTIKTQTTILRDNNCKTASSRWRACSAWV